MHGGASGSSAPRGNQNALKGGLYTKTAIEERRLRRSQKLLQNIKAASCRQLSLIYGLLNLQRAGLIDSIDAA
jgi:uncharacterized protein YjcR